MSDPLNLNMDEVSENEKDVKMTGLTEPVFILQISESSSVVTPVAVEIHIAILSSLKHLKYYETGYIVHYQTQKSILDIPDGH